MLEFKVSENDGTLRRWFLGSAPQGVYRIRLQQYLADCGYHVQDLISAPPEIRLACQLLAYDLATDDEIAVGFGLPKNRWDRLPSMLIRGSMAPERLEKGRSYVAQFSDLLAEENGRRRALLGCAKVEPTKPNGKVAASPAVSESQTAQLSAAPPPELMKDHDAVAAALAAMLLSSYPLLQYVNSDNFTPEERRKLRERLGFFGAMNISTELNRLCSERAREQFSEGSVK